MWKDGQGGQAVKCQQCGGGRTRCEVEQEWQGGQDAICEQDGQGGQEATVGATPLARRSRKMRFLELI